MSPKFKWPPESECVFESVVNRWVLMTKVLSAATFHRLHIISPKCPRILSRALYRPVPPIHASASITIPAATMAAAIMRGRAGPSPNQIRPIIAAKITDVSRSADTMPSGALLLA